MKSIEVTLSLAVCRECISAINERQDHAIEALALSLSGTLLLSFHPITHPIAFSQPPAPSPTRALLHVCPPDCCTTRRPRSPCRWGSSDRSIVVNPTKIGGCSIGGRRRSLATAPLNAQGGSTLKMRNIRSCPIFTDS